jgi:thiol-disulfide isomerase/thioredoxin
MQAGNTLASRLVASAALSFLFAAAAPAHAGDKNKDKAAPVAATPVAAKTERTPTLEEAKALSQRLKKTLVLEFSAKWCGPCKEFDRRVLPNPAVQRALSQVVYIHYDAEEQPGQPAARALAVIGYPTFMALGQDGRLIERLEGYRGAREFVDWLSRVSTDFESDDVIQVRLQRDPGDAEALLVRGRRQAQQRQDEAAEATLGKAVVAAQTERPGKPKNDAVAAAADYELRIVRLRRMLREAPRKEMAEHLYAFPTSGSAEAAFHELVRRGPADALTLRAVERYVGALIESTGAAGKDKKADEQLLGNLNEAVYGCLRVQAYDAAERAARKLLAIDDKNPYYLDTLAEVLHLRGDRTQALALEGRALALVERQGDRDLRAVLLKNQARFSRAAHELPAELLQDEEELSPWERTTTADKR